MGRVPVTSPAQTEPDLLRAISALAVIKVNWDDDKDYIANFVPLVAHCLRHGSQDEISLSETQALIEETFGLRIPQGPLQTILGRMAREGLVRRRHGVYLRVADALEEIDLGSTREDVLRQHAHLVALLVDFAARHGREWEEEQAEQALLSYVEALAEPILGAVVEGEPIVNLPRIDATGSVLTSQFVLSLCEKEPLAFEYLVTIVKGTMLANVLFWPVAFAGGRTRLSEIEILLDTPIVLRGLGYAEAPYREPAEELLGMLVKEGAKLRIFEHTLHEVEGVLDGAAATYRTGTQRDHIPGDVVDFFASEQMGRSDVELAIASLRDRLEQHHIEVVQPPEHSEEDTISERDLETTLKEGVHYGRHGTMVKDLKSLTAIYRMRDGEVRRHIESCDAVMVTSNNTLAHVSKVFFAEHFGTRSVPLCMTDYALAALAWLMNPAQAPDLPRRQIVAISYAALNPPEEVWRKYLAEIRRLHERGELTEEQVGLLLYSPDARLELMNATSGDPDALATGTISQILQHAEAEARAEVESELEAERARRKQAEATAIAEKARAATETAKARQLADGHRQRIDDRSRQLAGVLSWIGFVACTALLVIACAAAAQGVFPASWSRVLPLASALVFVFGVSGLLSMVTGWNLLDARRASSSRLEPLVRRMLERWLSPIGPS
jgi:hypothetical protein